MADTAGYRSALAQLISRTYVVGHDPHYLTILDKLEASLNEAESLIRELKGSPGGSAYQLSREADETRAQLQLQHVAVLLDLLTYIDRHEVQAKVDAAAGDSSQQ